MSKNLILLCSLILASSTACTQWLDDDENRQVLRIGVPSDAKTLDPASAFDSASLLVMGQVYETLYQYSYLRDPFVPEPLLAADFPKYSEDRLTVTIPIRKGIYYAPDEAFEKLPSKKREMKAQDFVYALKRQAHPNIKAQGSWLFEGKIKGFKEFKKKLHDADQEEFQQVFEEGQIVGFQAKDDYTLEIRLLKPYPQLVWALSMTFVAPIPKEAIEKHGDENGAINSHPVGTGPFVLKKWRPGHRIILVRNDHYHSEFYPTSASPGLKEKGLLKDAGETLPFLEKIVFDIVKESQPRWLKFLKGRYDLNNIPKDNFDDAMIDATNLSEEMEEKGIKLHRRSANTFWYVCFNMADKIVGKSIFLRQAISSAIDRDEFIKLFTNDRGIKMETALPHSILGRPKNPKLRYDLDLARAKRLLKMAGYPKGKNLPPLTMDMRGSSTSSRQMGEFFVRALAQIGIKLKVQYNTFPRFLEKMRQGNLQISFGGWTMDYPDAENVYQLLYGPNRSPGLFFH